MSRLSRSGRSLKRWLEYQLDCDINDAEMAKALGVSPSTYSRRKDEDENGDMLVSVAEHFGLNRTALLVEFGMLDIDELREYVGAADQEGSADKPPPLM